VLSPVIAVTYFCIRVIETLHFVQSDKSENVVSFASLEDRPFALLEDRSEPRQDELVLSGASEGKNLQ